ncbi:MAG TPA: DUF4397 domain-containing protein [Longimicrobiales bacterium]
MRIRCGVVAALLAAAACGETTGPDLQLDSAVRVVHAAPETPRLDVILQGETRAQLEYAEVSEYFTVGAGARELQLNAAGSTTPLIEVDTTFAMDAHYTVLAAGRAGSIQPIILEDDPTPADTGQARIRLVHAAPTAGAVDIYVTEPGIELTSSTPTLTNVDFGATSDYMVLDARTWRVRVTVAGTQTILIDLPLLVLSSTRVFTVVMMDTMGSGPPHGLIVLSDRG